MKAFKLVLLLFSIALLCMFGYIYININKILTYYPLIEKYSYSYKVDPLLITAIIKTESNFNADAKSRKGAIGLMQIMPSTAKEIATQYLNYKDFKEDSLFNPEINVQIGVYYVKFLSEMFNNNINLVLSSYNAGLGNVKKWHQENPIIEYDFQEMPFGETKNYVSKIDRIYKILKYFNSKNR